MQHEGVVEQARGILSHANLSTLPYSSSFQQYVCGVVQDACSFVCYGDLSWICLKTSRLLWLANPSRSEEGGPHPSTAHFTFLRPHR